jgi:hypothetical protein
MMLIIITHRRRTTQQTHLSIALPKQSSCMQISLIGNFVQWCNQTTATSAATAAYYYGVCDQLRENVHVFILSQKILLLLLLLLHVE